MKSNKTIIATAMLVVTLGAILASQAYCGFHASEFNDQTQGNLSRSLSTHAQDPIYFENTFNISEAIAMLGRKGIFEIGNNALSIVAEIVLDNPAVDYFPQLTPLYRSAYGDLGEKLYSAMHYAKNYHQNDPNYESSRLDLKAALADIATTTRWTVNDQARRFQEHFKATGDASMIGSVYNQETALWLSWKNQEALREIRRQSREAKVGDSFYEIAKESGSHTTQGETDRGVVNPVAYSTLKEQRPSLVAADPWNISRALMDRGAFLRVKSGCEEALLKAARSRDDSGFSELSDQAFRELHALFVNKGVGHMPISFEATEMSTVGLDSIKVHPIGPWAAARLISYFRQARDLDGFIRAIKSIGFHAASDDFGQDSMKSFREDGYSIVFEAIYNAYDSSRRKSERLLSATQKVQKVLRNSEEGQLRRYTMYRNLVRLVDLYGERIERIKANPDSHYLTSLLDGYGNRNALETVNGELSRLLDDYHRVFEQGYIMSYLKMEWRIASFIALFVPIPMIILFSRLLTNHFILSDSLNWAIVIGALALIWAYAYRVIRLNAPRSFKNIGRRIYDLWRIANTLSNS